MSAATPSPVSLLTGSCLADISDQLERTGWAAQLFDAEWRAVWVSDELKQLVGEEDLDRLGYGHHMLERFTDGPWMPTITDESRLGWLMDLLPRMAEETPGGKEALAEMLPEEALPLLDQVGSAATPDLWASHIEFVQGELPTIRVNYVGARVRDQTGEFLGTLFLYGPSLPASLLALVARGDPGMFERMVRLVEPGRHRAAILFADIQSSGVLSRRLPSSAYFRLVRAATTAVDDAVVRNRGIVGKHAGDGVTAFFLADDLGSASAAARAAIHAARSISGAAETAAMELGDGGVPVDLREHALNVGVHWGGALYMGQVVTGGRLEVTALGDEVNECARMQESARDGAVLASKSLLERLDEGDARALSIDPDRVAYRTVAELSGASEKAVRDAGGLPVTPLFGPAGACTAATA